MRPDGRLAMLRDVAGKAAEQAARIAGVLETIEDASALSISADAMIRACELADWHLCEAARLANDANIPAAIRDALDWLHGRGLGTVTAATLQKAGPGPLRRKARLDPAIEALEQHGWLKPVDVSRRAWRVSDQRASSGCYDESGASQPISGQQVSSRDGRDDGLILCRPTGRQGGDRWRRAAAVHSQGQG
jgi:hypothetical protein